MNQFASGLLALALVLATLVACLAASGATGGAMFDRSSDVAGRCNVVATGTRWPYKGQRGNAYTVGENSRAACALGVEWLLRLANTNGAPETPPGSSCINAVSAARQCESRSGGVFEWTARLK
jgi:hypothetical protein